MKNLLNLLFAILLVVAMGIYSCSKKSDNSSNFNYTVTGIQDMTVSHDTTFDLPLNISAVSGTPETVTLTMNGLPANVVATPASATGIPSFTTSIRIDAYRAAAGTYPVTLVAKSPNTAEKTYKFNLTLTIPSDCAASFVGSYTGTSDESSLALSPVISRIDANTVTIPGFNGQGINITAVLSCTDNTIIVPIQNPGGGDTFYGSGLYTKHKVVLNYFRTYASSGITSGPFNATYVR
jgi:hypothetical protein